MQRRGDMSFWSKEKTQYNAALSWLSWMSPTLHTHVLNLGKPELTHAIPTACVKHHGEGLVASSKSHYFSFKINPDFADKLSKDDYAFVLSHECFHILLGHLAVFDKYPNRAKFNIATDCIINDYLYTVGIEPDSPWLADVICYGMNVVGFDTSQSSLDEVYNRIPDEMAPDDGSDAQCQGNCSGDPDDSGAAGSGTCDCPTGQTVDDHDSMFGSGDPKDGNGGRGEVDPAAVKKAIEDFIAGGGFKDAPNEMKDFIHDNNAIVQKMFKDDRPDGGWSPTGFAMTVEEQLAEGVSMKWAELMQKITPDLYRAGNFSNEKKHSFARPNRKLITTYPKAVMPYDFFESGGVGKNDKHKDNNLFVIALDHSGSVSANDKRMFAALARSIPSSKAKIICCTFSTQYVPYDLEAGPGQRVAGGGTDFSAIEQFVQEKVIPEIGHYPKAIVVITDGEATFARGRPDEEHLKNNWYWLISRNRVQTMDSGINTSCKGNMFNLADFQA